MMAESIHSLVDIGHQLLLLYGLRQTEHRPTPERPLGHGRELYFWSFIVAPSHLLSRCRRRHARGRSAHSQARLIQDAYGNYIVLGPAVQFEGTTCWIALR